MKQPFITTGDIAKKAGLSITTVRDILKEQLGELPVAPPKRPFFKFPPEDLERLANLCRENVTRDTLNKNNAIRKEENTNG